MTKMKENWINKENVFEDIHINDEPGLLQQMNITNEALQIADHARTDFVGLAPFLRMSIAGDDLSQLSQLLLTEAGRDQENANLWMNLSTVLYALQVDDTLADSIQQQALLLQRTYTLPSSTQPAKFRLLMLMMPGNLAENMPLDCLLKGSSVELIYYYLSPNDPLTAPLPEHDAVMVAFSDSTINRPLLERLTILFREWPRPVINLPQHVLKTERHRASEVLQDVPGLVMPQTYKISRAQLEAVVADEVSLGGLLPGDTFPVILRPVSSHGGHGLERIVDRQALADYLNQVITEDYYLSPFIDYSSQDGQFRKFRIVLIDGKPFASHMAISSHWMIHYLNAGMYEDAAKRTEEQAFMECFNDFVQRHSNVLGTIHERVALDYLCIDCAETQDGELLIFEIDHCMVVHAMDPVDLFPYKQLHMTKVRRAFENYLFGLRRPQSIHLKISNENTLNSLNRLNFSGGPGALPETVLEQVREAIVAVPEVGLSVIGISHRSDWFAGVVAELEANIRDLLGIGHEYHVLFLQGGATQQFSMVPMNLLRGSVNAAHYLHTGYWSGKALPEARREGPVNVAWSGVQSGFSRLPSNAELELDGRAPYLHYISNETVEGLQFHDVMGREDVPRICDMSSDFLSQPGEYERFAMIYAHAQKNIGPAGVTVVVLRDELMKKMGGDVPTFLDYRAQAAAHSVLNTPPVFAIYVTLLVTRWLRDEMGGLAGVSQSNAAKAKVLYQALDASNGFYLGRAAQEDRSLMNVVFNLDTPEMEARFLDAAERSGFSGLAGHRSVGGIRASIYNGLELSAAEELANFMEDFRKRQHR